jgi:hypothetical protein
MSLSLLKLKNEHYLGVAWHLVFSEHRDQGMKSLGIGDK